MARRTIAAKVAELAALAGGGAWLLPPVTAQLAVQDERVGV